MADTPQQLRIFVSHSHKDNKFCHRIVKALRDAGADVWYDEHNMNSGRLGPTIERELRSRPVFVAILSPAALSSQWVEDETRWAYGLLRKDPSRLMLPVTAASIQEDDIWLFLQEFKRIEAPGCNPFPVAEAVRYLVRTLSLTPQGATPNTPQATEDVDELLTRGQALLWQNKYEEALPLCERATHLAPNKFIAWYNLGLALHKMGRTREAISVVRHAIALDFGLREGWKPESMALEVLGLYEEALSVYDRVIALDPNNAQAWVDKGQLLYFHLGRGDLGRRAEALANFNHAVSLDPTICQKISFSPGGDVASISDLKKVEAVLQDYTLALIINPDKASFWVNKALALRKLGRTDEAEAAEKRARELGWTDE